MLNLAIVEKEQEVHISCYGVDRTISVLSSQQEFDQFLEYISDGDRNEIVLVENGLETLAPFLANGRYKVLLLPQQLKKISIHANS